MHALILAGGKGIRLRPLTIHTPKLILPIVNCPFLLYQIDLLKRGGANDITLSLSYQPGKIEEIIGNGEDYGVHIRYTTETVPLGTAGAYKSLSDYLTSTAVVVNGDILTSLDLGDVIRFHREKGAMATIVTTPVSNPAGLGIVEFESDGRVRSFKEKPHVAAITESTINAGVYVFEPSILELIPHDQPYSFEEDLFPALVEANEKFYAYVWDGYWLDIGTPSRYLQGNLDILNGCIEASHLSNISGLKDYREQFVFTGNGEPPRIDGLSVIDPSCTIKSGNDITSSVLGPNCFVEEKGRIENSVVHSGARVGAFAVVRNSIIGRGAIVGRNATVDGAVLGDKSSLTDYTII
jgi:mannose-1-phosphate guanylyltransferase